MVGDRMDTDVVAGLEAGLHTILVLSGVSDEQSANRYPYKPSRIVASVDELANEIENGVLEA
jgi:NagD protein